MCIITFPWLQPLLTFYFTCFIMYLAVAFSLSLSTPSPLLLKHLKVSYIHHTRLPLNTSAYGPVGCYQLHKFTLIYQTYYFLSILPSMYPYCTFSSLSNNNLCSIFLPLVHNLVQDQVLHLVVMFLQPLLSWNVPPVFFIFYDIDKFNVPFSGVCLIHDYLQAMHSRLEYYVGVVIFSGHHMEGTQCKKTL